MVDAVVLRHHGIHQRRHDDELRERVERLKFYVPKHRIPQTGDACSIILATTPPGDRHRQPGAQRANMPTMRPKRVLVDALERKIREVLVPRDEANPKPVQVDLRGGLISLEDVKFAAPKKLTLPFQIRDSLVRRVRIRFSIKRILTQQLDVHLEGLALVLEPRHGDPTVEEARDIFRGAKQRAILGAEMWSVPLNSLLERELRSPRCGCRRRGSWAPSPPGAPSSSRRR